MIIGKILRSQNKEKCPVICLLYSKLKQLLKLSSIYIAQHLPFKNPGLTGVFPYGNLDFYSLYLYAYSASSEISVRIWRETNSLYYELTISWAVHDQIELNLRLDLIFTCSQTNYTLTIDFSNFLLKILKE